MVLAAVAATAVAMLRFDEPRLGAMLPVGTGGGGCCVAGAVAEVPFG